MTEVTRVPLQPIASGSLLKFFLGVIVGAALASAVAWFITRPPSVDVDTVTAGTGANPQLEDVVFIKYKGMLEDGTVFDEQDQSPMPIPGIFPDGVPMAVDGAVPGFRDALLQTQKGGKYVFEIPASLAYGDSPPEGSPIPANADLKFEVEVVDFMPRAQAEQLYMQMMQQMQAQQGEGGAPAAGAAPAEAPAAAPAPAQ